MHCDFPVSRFLGPAKRVKRTAISFRDHAAQDLRLTDGNNPTLAECGGQQERLAVLGARVLRAVSQVERSGKGHQDREPIKPSH